MALTANQDSDEKVVSEPVKSLGQMLHPGQFPEASSEGSGLSLTGHGSVHLAHGLPSAYGTSHPADVALGIARSLQGFKEAAGGRGIGASEALHHSSALMSFGRFGTQPGARGEQNG